MQTILPPSGNTTKILGKARSAEHGLRWMTYVLAQPVEGGVLVFHTLTRALLLLTPEEYAAPDNLPELRSSWFRVPQEIQTVFFLESNNSLIALIQRIDLVLINPVVNHNGLRNFLSLETVLYRLHQITADCDHKVTALAAELVEPHHGIGDELTLSVADSQHLLRVKVLNVINVLCVFYPLAPNAQ